MPNTLPSATTVPDADWFLQKLVDTVNHSEIEMPITFTCGGILIAGILTSGTEYFRAVAAGLAEQAADDPSTQQSLNETFERYVDIYKGDDDAVIRTPPAFVHLRDARFFTAASEPLPTREGVWWRGRLTTIDGFHFGMLAACDD